MTLTKYKEGSLRELWAIAFPLMISSLSVMAMLFVNRLLLAHYSTEALNASVSASTQGWVFVFGWVILASIGEVFVAQYNGKGLKQKLGEPVWQMIWLSLFSLAFFIPAALWGDVLIYGSDPSTAYERDYFRWMMIFGWSYPLYGALTGFFVGQGKTFVVTALAVVANLVNAGLDVVLIFGVDGYIPSLGIVGAAISTSGSLIFQALVLLILFLNKSNRKEFGTSNWKFDRRMFIQCCKIGAPSAAFMIMEIQGWALFYWFMTLVGERYITVVGVCQSIFMLMYFFAEGVSKASSTIVGNFIGSNKHDLIPKVIWAGMRLHGLFSFALLVGFYFFADQLIRLFLPEADEATLSGLRDAMIFCMLCDVVYIFFEGIRLLILGVLTAAGDTFFLMISGTVSIWLFLIVPVYYAIVIQHAPVEMAGVIYVFFSIAACAVYYWRYQAEGWRHTKLIEVCEA